MSLTPIQTSSRTGKTVISIDALGGDGGLGAIVSGMAKSAAKNPELRYIVHGDAAALKPLIDAQDVLSGIIDLRNVVKTVKMDDKPSRALRSGKDSSMWNALESVREKEADVAISCGNTGALMAMSMLRLRKAPGINRPAIAVLWPSRNPGGHNIVLDVGADIRADAEDLLQYALMGAAYARYGLDLARPRVGLLNVGTEEHKGRPELHEAAPKIETAAAHGGFEYVGYVEGSDISSARVDVVVTNGFTGNIALKTAEGTAALTRDFLRAAFNHSPLSRLGALFAITSLKRLSKRMDPRQVNGGIFLGLNGLVVKSHGSADATGMSAAIKLAFILAQKGFNERMLAWIAAETSNNGKGGDAEKNIEAL